MQESAIRCGGLESEIAVVVSSHPDAGGIRLAKLLGLPVHIVSRTQYRNKRDYSRAVFEAVRAHMPDLVCLAGFLPILEIPSDYERRVLNLHPSLLPDFGGKGMYGMHVHEAVLSAGVHETGCTVHHCDDDSTIQPEISSASCSDSPTMPTCRNPRL